MTESQAIETIAARFASQWPTLTAAITGGPFPFALKDETLPATDTFALCTWKHTGRAQYTQGQPSRKQARLLVLVKLWTPVGQSSLVAQLADVCRKIFEGQALGGSSSVEPVTVLAGASGDEATDARWTMQLVTFPAFYYEQS